MPALNVLNVIVPNVCVAAIAMCCFMLHGLLKPRLHGGGGNVVASASTWSIQKKLRILTVLCLLIAKSFHLLDYIRFLIAFFCDSEGCLDFTSKITYEFSQVYNVFIFLAMMFTSLCSLDRYRRIHLIVRGSRAYSLLFFISGFLIFHTIVAIILTLLTFYSDTLKLASWDTLMLAVLVFTATLPLACFMIELIVSWKMVSTTLSNSASSSVCKPIHTQQESSPQQKMVSTTLSNSASSSVCKPIHTQQESSPQQQSSQVSGACDPVAPSRNSPIAHVFSSSGSSYSLADKELIQATTNDNIVKITMYNTQMIKQRTERHRRSIRFRLFGYLSGVFLLNVLCLLFFVVGTLIQYMQYELCNISTSYLPFSAFMSFRLLNVSYNAFKRSKQVPISTDKTKKEHHLLTSDFKTSHMNTRDSYDLKFNQRGVDKPAPGKVMNSYGFSVQSFSGIEESFVTSATDGDGLEAKLNFSNVVDERRWEEDGLDDDFIDE